MYQDKKSEIKNELYSIGEIAEVTGLSVSTIRFYSEKGLIVPSYIDESTGYRYFSSRHVWKLEIIKLYKQLGFSLDAILELQETKSLDVLEQILDKSEYSIKKQLEKCQETLENLNWLREQCDVFRRAKAEEGFVIRNIAERNVLYMGVKSELDLWDLVMLHQKKIRKELQSQKTIQRCYGYILKNTFLEEGELKIVGEYVDLNSYSPSARKELRILPGGKYLCLRKPYSDWNNKKVIQTVEDMVKTLKIKPDLMILEEVSLYLLSWEDTLYELQIRIPE